MEPQKGKLQIDVPPEVASGKYTNLPIVQNGPNEFFIDFVAIVPNMPQAKVQSRVIMSPETAKNLLFTLRDSLTKYEATFGEIIPRRPRPADQSSLN